MCNFSSKHLIHLIESEDEPQIEFINQELASRKQDMDKSFSKHLVP